MKGALLFIVGSGAGKVLPLLFGIFIANLYGHESYAHLVQILVQSNFLTTVGTVSYVQLILATSGTETHLPREVYAVRGGVFSALVSGLGALAVVYVPLVLYDQGQGVSTLGSLIVWASIAAYSFGNSVLTIAMSQLNSDLRNARAGLTMLVGMVVSYCGGFTMSLAGYTDDLVFLMVAMTLLCYSIVAYWRYNRGTLSRLGKLKFASLWRDAVPLEKNHFFIMIFVGGILLAHSYVVYMVRLRNEPEAAAAFSMSYQLFSIGMFVPSILGNVVVPRLGMCEGAGRLNIYVLTGIYGAVALLWVIAIVLFGDEILARYQLTANATNVAIMRILQVAVFFGALSALLNQTLAAKGRFSTLAGLSMVYLASVVVFSFAVDFEGADASTAIVAGYVFVLLVGLGALWTRPSQD